MTPGSDGLFGNGSGGLSGRRLEGHFGRLPQIGGAPGHCECSSTPASAARRAAESVLGPLIAISLRLHVKRARGQTSVVGVRHDCTCVLVCLGPARPCCSPLALMILSSTPPVRPAGEWRIEPQIDRVTGAPMLSPIVMTNRVSNSGIPFALPARLQLACFKECAAVITAFLFKISSTRNAEVGRVRRPLCAHMRAHRHRAHQRGIQGCRRAAGHHGRPCRLSGRGRRAHQRFAARRSR